MAVNITATRTSTLFTDNDLDGVFDPGDIILTKIRITNTGDADGTTVSVVDTLNGVTLVPGSVQVTPIAFDDLMPSITGNTPITFTAAQLLGNDVDPDGAEINLTITGVSNAVNGAIVNNGNGTYTFTPTTGFTGTGAGGASFQYSIQDEQTLGSVTTGIVKFDVTDPTWYVNNATGSDVTGDGSYANPFATLAPLSTGGSADALDNANDTIFVYNAGTYTAASIVLETGQKLFGDGHAYSVNGLSIGANTSNTTLGHTGTAVTLADGNTVMGLDLVGTVGSPGAIGISDGGVSVGTLVIDETSITGTGKAIDIDNGGAVTIDLDLLSSTGSSTEGVHLQGLTGTFNATGGTIQTSTGTGVLIGAAGGGTASSGGTVDFTYGGDITSPGGSIVEIQDRTGGTVTFSGVITEGTIAAGQTGILIDGSAGTINFNGQTFVSAGAGTGNGVTLTGNSGTINFAPTGTGLDITTTSGTGLTFTGGGTLNITGAANSITTGTGQIMNLGGTMGTSGIAFQTLSSGIAAGNAININNLDAAGAGTFSGGAVTIAGTSAGGDGISIIGGSNSTFNFASATIDNTAGDAIELNGANGAVTFTTVNLDGMTGTGINIVNATNAVNVNGGSIGGTDDSTGDGVHISGGSGAVTIAATVSKITAGGDVVDISGHSGGTILLSGQITANSGAGGISVTGNSGGIINFTGANTAISTGATAAINIGTNGASVNFSGGGLNLDTTSGTAFSATGGGSVSISGATNTIDVTSGRAVGLDSGTIINGSGITLQSVNATGGGNTTIYLNNTNAANISAGFTITGIGTTDGSGGTINGITGADGVATGGIGVYLNNTDNVVLQNMDFGSLFNNYAIRGNEVNNFTLRNSDFGDPDQFDNTIGNSNAADEGAILFTNLTGTGLFEGNQIYDGYEDVVSIENNTGTLVVTFQDTAAQQAIIGNNDEDSDGGGADVANGNDGILIETNGNANLTVSIIGVEFKGARADMIQTNTQASSTMNVTIKDNTFFNTHNDIVSGGGGIRVGGGGIASNYNVTYLIDNNQLKGAEGDAIHALFQGQTASIIGVISNNKIGTDDVGNPDGTNIQAETGSSNNGSGIHVGAENFDGAGQMNHRVRIEDNQIRDIYLGSGIIITANGDDDPNSTRVEVNIKDNDIEEMGNNSLAGINARVGGGTQVAGIDRSTLGLILTNNRVDQTNAALASNAVIVDQVSTQGSVYVPGYNGGANSLNLSNYWTNAPFSNILVNGGAPNVGGGSKVDAITVTNISNANFSLLPMPLFAVAPNTDWETEFFAQQAAYQAAQDAANATGGQSGETSAPAGEAAAIVIASSHGVSVPLGAVAAAQVALDRISSLDRYSTLAEARAAAHAAREGSGQAAGQTGEAFAPAGDTAPAAAPAADDGIVSQAELAMLVDAAIQRWINAGATAEQVAAMRATTVSITDMAGVYVGSSDTAEILLDSDGAGHGWFIDSTPLDDSEYDGIGTRLAADAGGAADGRIDLLTVIMHELGHQIGLDDDYLSSKVEELMYGYVNIGERRLPGSDDAVGAVPGSVVTTAFALAPVSIGTLPPGKAVDVFFKSTIDSQTDKLITNLNNDSTVSGNFVNVVANEVNALDTLTLGNLVFLDVNEDGNFDSGTDTGIVGVSVSLYADTDDSGAWDPGDVLLGSQSTLAGGLYSFTGLAPGDYIVVVNATNFTSGQALEGKVTIPGGADPDDNVDDDDNGVPGTGGAVASAAITLAYNEEPTAGTGNDTNNTLDFGFVTPEQAPTLTATAVNPTYKEGTAAADLYSAVTASTVEGGQTFTSMTLTVSNVTDGASENLIFDGSQVALTDGNSVVGTAINGLTVTVSVAAGTATVSFSGATLNAVQLQDLIDGLRYINISQNPTDANRVVTITQLVDSGSNTPPDSNTATLTIATTVNVDAVNDAPEGADNSDTTVDIVDLVFDLANFETGMVDAENHTLASVIITTLPATGVIKLNGTAILAGAEITRLQLTNGNLTYTPPGFGSGGTSPTFTFQVRDNGGTANSGIDLDGSPNTFTINITPSNAPALVDLDGPGGTSNYATNFSEGGAAVAVTDTDPDITDADDATVVSATITITDAIAGDVLTLSGALPGSIIASGEGTAVLTLSGSGTHEEYEQALALILYSSSSDNPTASGSDLTRSVTVSINDGNSQGPVSTTTITIAGINDAPVNSLGGTIGTGEDAIDAWLSGMSVSDVDANPATQDISVTFDVDHGTLDIRTDVVNGITAADIISQTATTITVQATQNEINTTLAASNGLTYSPDLDFNGTDTLTVTTNDLGFSGTDPGLTGDANSEEDIDTRTITVSAANDAPTVAGDGTEDAAPIDEEQPSATGQTFDSVLSGQYSDAKDDVGDTTAGAFTGVAVTANGSTAGTGQWQYSTNGGVDWTDIGTASLAAAKLFNVATAFRFNPAPDFSGSAPTLTVRLIDDSGAAITDGEVVDLSGIGATGGTSRYSSGSVVISQAVNAVNDPPAGTDATIVVDEDTFHTLVQADFGFTDPVDGTGTLASVTITGVTGGSLYYDADGTAGGGAPVAVLAGDLPQTYTVAEIDAGNVLWRGNVDLNGTGAGTLTFKVTENNAEPNNTDPSENTLTFDITAVNDSPVVPDSPTINATEQVPITVNPALVVSDVDLDARNGGSGDYGGAQFVMNRTVANAQDSFTIPNGAGFTVSGGDLQAGGLTFGTWASVGGVLTITFTSSATAATTALVNAVLQAIQYTNTSNSPPASIQLTYSLDDGSPGGGQGTGASDTDSGTVTVNIADTEEEPVVDLNGAGPGTSTSLNYTEDQPLTAIAPAATVVDPDTADFDGGTLTIAFTANGAVNDRLDIINQGTGVGQISVANPDIFYNFGNVDGNGDPVGPELIGTYFGGNDGDPLVITLNDKATPQVTQALVRLIGYYNVSNAPSELTRELTFTLSDGEGATSLPAIATIGVTATADPPQAEDDSFITTEDAAIVNGNLFADNGNGNDSDPDGNPLTIVAVSAPGHPVIPVGTQVTLQSGALLTVRADGTFDYDPNDQLNTLVYPGSGAVNEQAVDTFTYTISGGDSANVTVTVVGVTSPEDIYMGDATDNVITGTEGNDYFLVKQGGSDTLFGLGGSDFFFFGTALNSGDAVDGGAGNDQIAIQGNYNVTFGAGVVDIESLVLLPGNDVRFGDVAGNFYDYVIITVDANLGAGGRLTVDANRLRAGEDFTFNGSAETNGNFFVVGGNGVDTLTGGAQSDTFLFVENGQFGGSDVVNGGPGGTNDQLALRGNYTITFGAGQLVNIDSIALVSALDTRFGPLGAEFDYNLTMNDGNVGAGQLMTIDAAPLRPGETLTFNGGAETNGSFRVAGGAGNDSMTGGAGADILIGRGGIDTMIGGGGNDQFRYNAITDSNSAGSDFILDFTTGDIIDLVRIDANTGTAADDAFTFIGVAAFTGVAGQLRTQHVAGPNWLIQGDVNGDGLSDFEFNMSVTDASPITSGDFIL